MAKLPPQIADMLNILETLRASATAAVPPHKLAVHTIAALQRRLDQYKRGHGLMSFEDMLTRMDQGLDPAHNPGAATLVGLLRRRFRYAVVDEFQDTDPVQWRILQRLFLEGGAGRLFVVGDPKQAIFNFRGADLDTYLTAKTQLAGKHDATVCTLDTNWRSSSELVAALNHVFEHGDWFAWSCLLAGCVALFCSQLPNYTVARP